MEDKLTIYQQNEDGSLTIVEEKTITIPSPESVISEKEAQLLKMYQELEALKSQNQ